MNTVAFPLINLIADSQDLDRGSLSPETLCGITFHRKACGSVPLDMLPRSILSLIYIVLMSLATLFLCYKLQMEGIQKHFPAWKNSGHGDLSPNLGAEILGTDVHRCVHVHICECVCMCMC